MGTTGQSITLANSIIGVGILAMPFCFQQCGVLLATIILLSMGLISRLCCYFLLKSALIARRRNFEFLAFHVFGSAGKLAVEVGIIGFLMGTCIAYFVVVGDLGPQIIAKMFNINQSDILRTSIMVIVSLVCVLPLGLLRNVDSLSNVSAATICFYFCLVLKVIAEAASQLLTSEWHTRMEMWKPSGFLQCVPIFSMALFCQAQLFEIFESLPSLSLEKMNVVTKNAINICTGVYFTLGIFGYIAFCSQNISGNILMSLSPNMANDVIKLGFVMSLAFSFPLIIFPCRASLYSFLYKKVHSSHHDHIINHSIPEGTFRIITVCIIAVALFISLLIPNIELVLGLVGSTIGVLICVVFPAACFVNVTFKNTNERVLAKAIVVLGLIIMVLGTYANLQAAERENNKVDRYDDKYITQERIDQIVEEYFQAKRLEKSEDVVIKPLADTDTISEDKTKVSDEIIKDSEIQPPNPVPPEFQSNEKEKPVINEVNDKDKKLKEIPPNEVETNDNILDSHPKNVKTKLKVAEISNEVNNAEDKKIEEKKEKTKPPSNEDKIDMMKQQQLIETIKQHGKEQKELIKEQKEILHEIMKTKEELKQNKKEEDSREAKKIAVESIQKIANMAIQSLSGVSEKPGQVQNAENQPLKKTANEAVQEIAKKAVETMEAIKVIKEKPKDQTVLKVDAQSNNIFNPVPVQNNQNIVENNQIKAQNSQPNAQSNEINAQYNQLNAQNNQMYVQNNPRNVQNQLNPGEIVQNLNNLNPANIQPVQNMNSLPNELNKQGVPNNAPVSLKQQIDSNNVPKSSQEVNPNLPIASNQQIISNNIQPNSLVNNDQTVNQNSNVVQNTANNQVIPNENQQPLQNHPNENILKGHTHSPDEPQSYKQGEELQKKNNPEHSINNGINKKVPLPVGNIAMNNAQENVNKAEKESLKVGNEKVNENSMNQANDNGKNNIENGAVNDNSINNLRQTANYVRQKREVVDCTEKTSLKPEDKQICETLLNIPKEPQDILPSKVDLNEVGLRNLPIDTGVIHLRSLKSFKEANKER